jgi:hypothetical protein
MYLAIFPLVLGCGGTLLVGTAAAALGVAAGVKAVQEVTKDKKGDKSEKSDR